MFGWCSFRIRHPLFPRWPAVPAARAKGRQRVIAGRFEELLRAAGRGVRVSHAVFVLIDEGRPLIGPGERDRLWQWFAVPSYVLVTDAAGRPRACECEARDGLHLAAGTAAEGPVGTSLC